MTTLEPLGSSGHVEQRPAVLLTFNVVSEFIAELLNRGPNVEPVVRITNLWADTRHLPIRHLSVSASFLRGNNGAVQVVRLREFCGQVVFVGDEDEASVKTMERAAKITSSIEEASRRAGFTVAGGVHHLNDKLE